MAAGDPWNFDMARQVGFDLTTELDDIRKRLQSLEARILSLGQTRAEWEAAQRASITPGKIAPLVKGCEQ